MEEESKMAFVVQEQHVKFDFSVEVALLSQCWNHAKLVNESEWATIVNWKHVKKKFW